MCLIIVAISYICVTLCTNPLQNNISDQGQGQPHHIIMHNMHVRTLSALSVLYRATYSLYVVLLCQKPPEAVSEVVNFKFSGMPPDPPRLCMLTHDFHYRPPTRLVLTILINPAGVVPLAFRLGSAHFSAYS